LHHRAVTPATPAGHLPFAVSDGISVDATADRPRSVRRVRHLPAS